GRRERGDGRGVVARVYLVGRVRDGVVYGEVRGLVLQEYEVRHALGHEGRVVGRGEGRVLYRELSELRERGRQSAYLRVEVCAPHREPTEGTARADVHDEHRDRPVHLFAVARDVCD